MIKGKDEEKLVRDDGDVVLVKWVDNKTVASLPTLLALMKKIKLKDGRRRKDFIFMLIAHKSQKSTTFVWEV